MSFLDDAKEALGKAEEFAKEHPDQIKAGLDKAKGLISASVQTTAGGMPVLILKEGTKESKGKDAQKKQCYRC
jgi:hypothetical protein